MLRGARETPESCLTYGEHKANIDEWPNLSESLALPLEARPWN